MGVSFDGAPNATRGRLRSGSTPVPFIVQNLMCRICERKVTGHLYNSHSELCSIKVQWEIRALECDSNLLKIYNRAVNLKQDNDNLSKILEISKSSNKRYVENPIKTLESMIKIIDTIIIVEKGEIGRLARDLRDWLKLKQEAWNNVLQATSLMKTFIGTVNIDAPFDFQTSVLTTHIPSIKDFEILKPITRGGFARVYLAKKRSCDDFYAIKVLDKQDIKEKTQVENVLAERNILATTSCPFVVRLYYAFQTKENLFLAMEFLNGGDFFSLLSALSSFEEDFTRFYIAECVLALEYLHARDIVHRGKFILIAFFI